MELLLPGRFEDPATAYGYVRTIFDQIAAGTRAATVSITPSTRHVGVTRRDTFRPGFTEAVRAAEALGYPVLVRSAGGGATAADAGTFGFSVIRPADGSEAGRGIRERYDEAAALVLGAFSRLGVRAEVGEVRDEFCPGDHSVRVGNREGGMKVVGIAQRVTRRATSVGGIVLVEGEVELARVLKAVYGAMRLPFRPESVGSLRRAGYDARTGDAIEAFALEAEHRYGAARVPLDGPTLGLARGEGEQY
ncbi:MAG: lipoyl protein ligase domain-containing protein [Rubrobacter sp.]